MIVSYAWTDRDIEIAISTLRRHTDFVAARAEIAAAVGHEVSSDSLRNALNRRGKGAPATHLGQDVPRPASPVRSTVAPAPETQVEAPPTGVEVDPEEALERLVKLTRKPIDLESLCDEMQMFPAQVRELVDQAKSRGLRVEIDRGHVGARPHEESVRNNDVAMPVAKAGVGRAFAVVGDVHAGSQHHMGKQLKDFCDYAYHERGVRKFLQVGDLLDGVYRHSIWEQSHRGYEEQCDALYETLPRYPDAEWPFIQGNHDETLGEANGLEVGLAIVQSMRARGRHDLTYLGARGAYARLVAPGERRGLYVHLWHPRDKGNAYAKSYRLQKQIEKYAPGTKPDALFAGHWHQQFYFTTRGVHGFSCGCWQGGGSSFGKSLGGQPEVGSWIVEYSMTDEGAVRRLSPEWTGYQEKEAVRDVSMG